MPPSRRDVLKTGSALAMGGRLTPLPISVPRASQVVKICAPADKGLDAAFFASLREKGEGMRAAGDDLQWIGMPVGGICTGQLYLSGDGQLWNCDIFNQPPNRPTQNGPAYEHPLVPDVDQSPLKFFFSCDGGEFQRLTKEQFPDTVWSGQWPIGKVAYRGGPVDIDLEAFSPFSPLDAKTSGMPITCFVFRATNTGATSMKLCLRGEIENVSLKWSGNGQSGVRRAMPLDSGRWVGVLMDAALRAQPSGQNRPDVLVEDWSAGYAKWTATGTAFGTEPQRVSAMPSYQGEIGATTIFVVNSHNVRQGEDIAGGDSHTGRLTSQPFRIERPHLNFLIGGGNHPGKTCFNLLVDNKVVRSKTGSNSNRLSWQTWDVNELIGREGVLQIIDEAGGAWGNIGIGEVIQSDSPRTEPYVPEKQGDWGTLCLLCDSTASAPAAERAPLSESLASAVDAIQDIAPGASVEIRFIFAWHFANPERKSLSGISEIGSLRRWYATKWSNAASAAADAAANFDRLAGRTRTWNHAWYGGSLPTWFLERTIIPADALASSTCHRFDNGRFYGWEGIYCCPGTCTHVWGYAQSSGYLFPELERSLRRDIDFGLSWKEDGSIDYRGEYGRHVAHDGQCAVILRTLREHLNSPDNTFLSPIWPRVRQSIERLIADDKDRDGMLEGAQYNTLDATWYGPMGWISSLYVAALAAGERMAGDMGDGGFAQKCRDLASRGAGRIGEALFNGEYFIHKTDPAHPEANSTNDGCHIDQVFGESWLAQLSLPPQIDPLKVRSALRALWKYSFLPDVGPYRRDMKAVEGGRWYAMPGEAGLLMCSWPKGGAERAVGKGNEAWAAGYFNECMNGFEWQAAAHMISAGMVDEGLAVVRALHDRYSPARRNPYNEIECGDHYARSMASHGAYLTACGFSSDGPAQRMGFDPKINPESFSCAWTGPEGWGIFRQNKRDGQWSASLSPIEGQLVLRHLFLRWGSPLKMKAVLLGREISGASLGSTITFDEPLIIPTGTTLRLHQAPA